MAISEDKALEILTELIKKPESKAEDIPRIWGEILAVYSNVFAPAVEPVKKRRKRRATSLSPNLGWPQGVSRAEYAMWKESQQVKGITEGINPQEYKRLKDAGGLATTETPESTAKPATRTAEAASKDRKKKK